MTLNLLLSKQIQSGGEGVIQVAEFITTNNIPPLFLAMLLLQFVSMLIDRYNLPVLYHFELTMTSCTEQSTSAILC